MNSVTAVDNKLYLIKQRNKSLSIVDQNNHYVVGFRSALTARKVHYNMKSDMSSDALRLERAERLDVTRTVKAGLATLGVSAEQFRAEKVCIDTRALLFVPKSPALTGSAFDPQHDAGFHLATMDFSDFLMYPFEHNVGIILPYELLHERPHEFVFQSQVIDPCIDPQLFARALGGSL